MKCISLFKCNPQVDVIDKSHCSLEDVPNFQNYSRSLEELFLDANKLTVLNENVFKLTKLRRFSFSDNAIQDIPPDIAKLVNLVELDCSRNKIEVIPDQIKFLRGLQICDFSANSIQYLPPGLVQLKNLTCLTLNYCPIKNLPEDFGLLKSLVSLEMRENELETLPASITGLESLKKLDLGANLITKLPEDIGRLTNLEYLLVDGNRLETIPTKIGRLENLQCLDLGRQEPGLKHLPEEIGGLVSLTDLHLSENLLETLPDGIENLKNLTIFKADNNYLSELNENVSGCISLQELVLTANHISQLPSSIGLLTDLRSLNVDNNLLRELTPRIGNLKHLGILSLRDNLLTHLPDEIGHLEMAKVMDISGNCLEYLPISITALNLKALWLSKNQAQPLPKLQIDELPSSGTKVLTCYLLPQQNEGTNCIEDVSNANYEFVNRQAAVSFDTAAVDDAELSSDAQFVRHDTPFPRELKARHQKLFTNATTTPAKSELKGHDNASFNMADNPAAYDRELVPTYHHHVEYESNGLPEVLTTMPQSRNQFSEVTTVYRDNNYSQELNQHGGYDNGVNAYMQDYRFATDKSNQEDKVRDKDVTCGLRNDVGRDDKRNIESNLNLTSNYHHVLDIVVRRSKNHKPGLGLSIAGGKDTPPYKDDDEGIFVSKVTRGGPAEAAGVKEGDKILSVNSHIFYDGITHQKAVDIFKKVKPDCTEFTMRVLRDLNDDRAENDHSVNAGNFVTGASKLNEKSSDISNFTRTSTIPVSSETNGTSNVNNLRQLMKEPEKVKSTASTLPAGMSLLDNSLNKNIIYTTLVKDYKHDLGLVLENRIDESDSRSITITRIKPNSIASRDGKLEEEDRLLSINGVDVTGIDLDRVIPMLEGSERFIRIVVSRGDSDDPIGAALRNMPTRPQLGSWFSSTSNMSHRPSLLESYQRPTFGSVSGLQKQPSQLLGTKPPKPPKPTHLLLRDSDSITNSPLLEENPIASPRIRGAGVSDNSPLIIDAEKRAAWRRERMKSIDDDTEMAKLIAEAQRRKREEK